MTQRRGRDEEATNLLATKYPFAESVCMTEGEMKQAICDTADKMQAHYADKNLSVEQPLVIICVLKGSAPTAVALCTELARRSVPICQEFICVSSYGAASKSSGEVRILLDVRCSLMNRHVVLVEDICESGNTLRTLSSIFACRSPQSLEIFALLDKPTCRSKGCDAVAPKWVGKTLPNDGSFLVGGGLDWNERYRCLPDVIILKPEMYSAKPHHPELKKEQKA